MPPRQVISIGKELVDRLLHKKKSIVNGDTVLTKTILSDGATSANGSIMQHGRNFTRLKTAAGVRTTNISVLNSP